MIIGNCPVCGAEMRVGTDMTNADRIRNMTDEELAEILHNAGGNWYSEEYWFDWLKKETEAEVV